MVDTQLLVIEDDPDIAGMLALNLREDGHAVTAVRSGEDGLAWLATQACQLVVLDLMLPGIDGYEVCRRIRTLHANLAIIMVSARGAEAHRVSGLELGADDYLAKPFSMPELSARVRAVLRRTRAAQQLAAAPGGLLRHGGLTLDPVAREVRHNGQPVTLTLKEFDLLHFFMRQPGQAYKRIELLGEVWGYGHDGYEHTVNTHINRLRAKIETTPANPSYIVTVWGVGYKFVAPDAS